MSPELIIGAVVTTTTVVMFGVIAWAVFAPPKKPKGPEMIWHEMPSLRGLGTTPCCDVHPQNLPPEDRLTWDANKVTCPSRTIPLDSPSLFRRDRGW